MYYTLRSLGELTRDFPGFPSKKDEHWRHTRLDSWLERSYHQGQAPGEEIPCKMPYRILLEDGIVMATQLPKGVHIAYECGTSVGHEANPFRHINEAYATALCIRIDQSFEGALHVVHHYGMGVHHSRMCWQVDPGVCGVLVEHFTGGADAFITHYSGWHLESDASITHTVVQNLHAEAGMVAEHALGLERSAEYHGVVYAKGGALYQLFHHATLQSQSKAVLDALMLGAREQRHILCVDMHHDAPEAHSVQHSKQILSEGSVAVFDGRALIREGAQGAVVEQGAHSLLLNETAQVFAKPHLEIYTDDLQASHGATVGQLDEAAMVYLQTRGIGPDEAKGMLIHAFASEILEVIPDSDVREYLHTLSKGTYDDRSL